jgi:hypothetical protein
MNKQRYAAAESQLKRKPTKQGSANHHTKRLKLSSATTTTSTHKQEQVLTGNSLVILPMTRFALAKRMLVPIAENEKGEGNLVDTILYRGSTPAKASWGLSLSTPVHTQKTDIYTMPMVASSSTLRTRMKWCGGLSESELDCLLKQ